MFAVLLNVLMSSLLGAVTGCVDSSSVHLSLSSLHPTSTFLFPTLMSMHFSARQVDLPQWSAISIIVIIILIPRQCLCCCHHGRATAKVHSVHLMNVEWRQAAADPRPSQTTWAVSLPYRLPESTPTIAIYYYYSVRKLTLTLPSHGG